MGEHHAAAVPTAVYGAALLMPAIAGSFCRRHPGARQRFSYGVSPCYDLKGKISPVFYIGGIVLAFADTRISHAFYVLVALMWLVPDRRIERAVKR